MHNARPASRWILAAHRAPLLLVAGCSLLVPSRDELLGGGGGASSSVSTSAATSVTSTATTTSTPTGATTTSTTTATAVASASSTGSSSSGGGGWVKQGNQLHWSFDGGCAGLDVFTGPEVLTTETTLVRSPPAACRVCPGSALDTFGVRMALPPGLSPPTGPASFEVFGRASDAPPVTLHFWVGTLTPLFAAGESYTQVFSSFLSCAIAPTTLATGDQIFVTASTTNGECFLLDDLTLTL